MPTSHPGTLSCINMICQGIRPESVIDIGVGHGKSGVILREMLDIAARRYKRQDWTANIYGIEAFEEYHNPLWDYAYDEVLVCDAIEGMQRLPKVDLSLAIGIWEHFDRDYAERLLELCLNKSRFVVICTPVDPAEQGHVLGNPHEEHVSRWTPQDFSHVPCRRFITTGTHWIIVLSTDAAFPYVVWQLSSPVYLVGNALRLAFKMWWHRR